MQRHTKAIAKDKTVFLSRVKGFGACAAWVAIRCWTGLIIAFCSPWTNTISAQQTIPQPTSTGPGCWQWKYDPTQPIPTNAKVVPGTCATPDGRCYLVPSSACFKVTGVTQPLYNENTIPVPPPKPVAPPDDGPDKPSNPDASPKQPAVPFTPISLRPLNPKHETPTPLPNSTCSAGTGWDFESFSDKDGFASFDDWVGGGLPISPFRDFKNPDEYLKAAPVYGNAVPIQRIKPAGWLPGIETEIGGDYWRFSQDVNQHGDFWISSIDRRFSWKQHPGETRDTWGEAATGTLSSPSCILKARFLTFRLGGSNSGSQRIELYVRGGRNSDYYGVRFAKGGPGDLAFKGRRGFPTQFDTPSTKQQFPPPMSNTRWTIERSANPVNSGSDWMQVYTFDLAPFIGKRIRIRIVDDVRNECTFDDPAAPCVQQPEHLLTDDFLFSDKAPEGNVWMHHSDGRCGWRGAADGCSPIGRVASEPPLWGTTDVHAHPMANLGFGGHFIWGDSADTLEQVYDDRRPLPAIAAPGGRAAILQAETRTSCYLSGDVVALATGVLTAGCEVLNVVPFLGTGLAAVCTVAVSAAAAEATLVPIIAGAQLHGATKMSSGAVKIGGLFSSVLDVLPDLTLDFETGLLPQTDSLLSATGAEAGGWWKKGEDYHSPTGGGRTHNQYQADMIIRAYQGGLRLAVWDVINSRALDLVADGQMESDWLTLKDETDGARRIVASRLASIAAIASTPVEAQSIIRSGRLAIILGSEVDELGRMRPAGRPWPESPHSGPDSMQQQIDDLWELGIRKITPVHSVNNPIGGSALFVTKYVANNHFSAGTDISGTVASAALPDLPIVLDGTFGTLLKGLFLGDFSILATVAKPPAPPPAWNPADFFDFDLRGDHPEDKIIGSYNAVNYRVGIDAFRGGSSLRNATGWLAPKDVLGTQIVDVRLIKLPSLFVTGSTCNLKDTTLPGNIKTFGATVDAHFTQMDGHRNALGLFRGDDGQNGETFIRAAMKKGMLLDTDHLSMNMRVDLYSLARTYADEAGWRQCTSSDRRLCGDYPFVGVHSKVRTLEIDPQQLDEFRNAYGTNDEASKTDTELAHIVDNLGAVAVYPTGSAIIPPSTFACTKASDCANYNGPNTSTCQTNFTTPFHGVCQGILPTLVARTIELPPEISNDCDESTKTFATKYLYLLRIMGSHGLTPSTDFNGLATALKPRYGTANPWSTACGGSDRDHNDQAKVPTQRLWSHMMVEAQQYESSGVWYDDYASHGPVPSAAVKDWKDPRYKSVVARSVNDQRDDQAPRARVDDLVFYNDFGPDSPGIRGPVYTQGNRVGAQMYPMKRWRPIADRAGWDYNLDGLENIAMYPDLFQDMRNVGVQWEQLGPLFHAAQDYLSTWQRGVTIGSAHP
jgi:hypothetical protein